MRAAGIKLLAGLVCSTCLVSIAYAQVPPDPDGDSVLELPEISVMATAEEALKQMPGVSIITSDDIRRQPPVNDISELVRKMPGVNLSGNASSGQYGNNRQIDLRGMGPENTMIMIDGKPVHSRNSVRMGPKGERNSRGDSNWVPVDAIERIEVIRGPAAARYGSGAAGGVVNIITKKPTDKPSGSITLYSLMPENSDESYTRRATINLASPITETLSMRLFANLNKTTPDSLGINGNDMVAGREGVRNKDVDVMLRWEPILDQVFELDMGLSRQGNIYSGDRSVSQSENDLMAQLADDGAETNVMLRQNISLTHRGKWDFGDSRLMFLYEGTQNKRIKEGMTGGVEGNLTSNGYSTSRLKNYTANGEFNIPFTAWVQQTLTLGAEFYMETLDDPYSVSQTASVVPGYGTASRKSKSDAKTISFYVEDNIRLSDRWVVTPGARFDHHSEFGGNISPSLNTSYELFEGFSIKGGIARAFKAPNLYQSNPNYLYSSRGNGCPIGSSATAGCYIIGNDDLDPETSINKEIGVVYDHSGWNASLTYFHNKYDNKIVAGEIPLDSSNSAWIMKWDNATDATIQGLEGNLLVPLPHDFSWNTNFTYMIENEDQDGQPLSMIPKYTVNTSLMWQATPDLSFILSATRYGKQKPRNLASNRLEAADGFSTDTRKPYTLVDAGASYDINEHARISLGVRNLFDKQIRRSGNNSNKAGANVYNEPGRAYYLTLTAQF